MMYGSEVLFWSVPPQNVSAQDLGFTWLAYSLSTYVFLALLVQFRITAWYGLFLCGAVYGWLIEGVIVGEMYKSFPVQLAWTPLAWHMLLTVFVVFWLPRTLAVASLIRQLLTLLAMGVGFGIWALWWPIERQPIPEPTQVFTYLVGLAVFPIAAQFALDRWGVSLLAISRWEGIAVSSLLGALWLVQAAVTLRPEMLALPVLVGITLAALRHQPDGVLLLEQWLQKPVQPMRHHFFAAVPVLVWAMSTVAWAIEYYPPTNTVIFFVTTPLSVLVYMECLRRAFAQKIQ